MRAAPGPAGAAGADAVAVSVVLPCLNEAASVAVCVEQSLRAIRRAGLSGEVIVCDNGSTDGSAELAWNAGARVVHEPRRGYGFAYLRGFSEANGALIVMGDADASYDFGEIPRLLALLQDGYDYVVGSRFTGQILPGAMPWTHRYIGNPVLTGLLNHLFGTSLSDAHSGLRAMTRAAYDRLALCCTGMELASEIAVRAAQVGLRSIEVPITYHPRAGFSKLRPLRDGWRHVQFLLGMLPGVVMIVPGLLMLVLAAVAVPVIQSRALAALPGQSLLSAVRLALVALVSAQLVALAAGTHVRSLRLARQARGAQAGAAGRGGPRSRLPMVGACLFALGLAGELLSLRTATSHRDPAAAHLRLCVIMLATMMLRVQTSIAINYLAQVRVGASGLEPAPPAFAPPRPGAVPGRPPGRAGEEQDALADGRLSA